MNRPIPSLDVSARYEKTRRAQEVLSDSARRLLKPLIRLLLKHGMPYQYFIQVVKRAYLEVAQEPEFGIPGKGQSKARLALITGLSRPDVAELLAGNEKESPPERWNRAAAVLSAWSNDPTYWSDEGKPRLLPLRGKVSFASLVKDHGSDMPLLATLDELERVGCVERVETRSGQSVRLISHIYIAQSESPELLEYFGLAASRVLSTMTHNILEKTQPKFFQQDFWSRAIDATELDELRVELRRQLTKASSEAITALDSAEKLPVREHHRTAGVGFYYFEE